MKISTTVSLDGKLLEGARAYAKAERRSLSAQVEAWIEEKLAEDGAAACEHLEPGPDAEVANRKEDER